MRDTKQSVEISGRTRILPLGIIFLAIFVAFSGCAIKLAPDYDKTIIESLTSANESTLILFAKLTSPGGINRYSARESEYNDLIGKFDAIVVQAKSRPAPRSLAEQVTGSGPAIATAPDKLPVLEEAPTIAAVEEIVRIITRMRDQDRAGKLSKGEVLGLKNAYVLQMDLALTFEKALER